MVTGELAAQAVASASSLPALAAGYGRACNYEIGQELRDPYAFSGTCSRIAAESGGWWPARIVKER